MVELLRVGSIGFWFGGGELLVVFVYVGVGFWGYFMVRKLGSVRSRFTGGRS